MKCDIAPNVITLVARHAFIQRMALCCMHYDRTFDIESITLVENDYIKNSSKLHPCGITAITAYNTLYVALH